MTSPSARADSRRRRSAKARNRERWIAGGAAGYGELALRGMITMVGFWAEQLAGPTAAPLGVNALDDGPNLCVAVDCEDLSHAAARLAPVLEPHQPAGMVGTRLPMTGKRTLPRLATGHRN